MNYRICVHIEEVEDGGSEPPGVEAILPFSIGPECQTLRRAVAFIGELAVQHGRMDVAKQCLGNLNAKTTEELRLLG